MLLEGAFSTSLTLKAILDGVDLLGGGQLQGQGVVAVQQGIAQLVVLIGELDGGRVKDDALLHAVALGEGAGGDVADDNLQRHDRDLLHQGLPVRTAPPQSGWARPFSSSDAS